jgi:adenosylhomocysteine nucleosidase
MTDTRLAELVERAFDYRGYVTLRRTDGSELVGFVYDRTASHLDLFDETATRRLRIPLAEVADIAFTGEDAARKAQTMWERRNGTLEPKDTSAWGEWRESGPVLFVVALDRELQSVTRALGLVRRGDRARGQSGGHELVAVALGMGGGARRAVLEEQPRLVVSCGFSGGLEAALVPGDLVVATAVRDETGDELEAPATFRRQAAEALRGLRHFQGELVCTTSIAATEQEKLALARPGALAVDMESYPAARAAAAAGIPWMAIRAIVDPLRSSLPAFTRQPTSGYVAPALKHALGGPRAAAELLRLAMRARAAAAALEMALRRLAPALGTTTEARA